MEIRAWYNKTSYGHIIFRSLENLKSELLQGDFQRFTGRYIIKSIQENQKKSRKEFLLYFFKIEAEKSSNTTNTKHKYNIVQFV